MPKKPADQKPNKRKRRNKVDLAAVPLPLPDGLGELAGNLAVQHAVTGCTLSEKLLIAAMVPTILEVIRTIKPKDADQLLEALYPPAPGVPEA